MSNNTNTPPSGGWGASDYIINLFRYFSKFVPKNVLREMFRLPAGTQHAGYAEFAADVLAQPDTNVITEIGAFVLSANRKYVSDRVKNNKGIILFVEYGSINFDPTTTAGIKERVAVTVCSEFGFQNNDNLNEALLMNRTNNILIGILNQMDADQNELDACGLGKLINFPAEVLPVDCETFFDNSGWTALFENEKTQI